MKPRQPTQEDVDFWNRNDRGLKYVIGPMVGRHLGAEDIFVLKAQDHDGTWIIKVPWEQDDRDNPRMWSPRDTVWTTFWGGMPASDVVIT